MGRRGRRTATLRRLLAVLAVGAGTLLAPQAAAAAASCDEPGERWERTSPAGAGFDGAKLQAAIDRQVTDLGLSVRVFRNGCLVAGDRAEGVNREAQFQSWSLAKSVTSLAFGRAMSLGLISPDDPVGSLLPEADLPHGAITMRDLLTASSGLRWTGLRDYDVLMPDRVRDGLTVGIAHPPGTWFEYSQTGPALVAAAVARATGEDFQAFVQRELFGPVGIREGTWRWGRDQRGNTQGFFDLYMRTEDYARLGELMRRGGVWKGRRLLMQRYVRESVAPSRTNGCYGWLIWVNRAKPCILPTVTERPVTDERYFPNLPADTYHYEGLLGQVVTVMPSQGIVVARNGLQSAASLAGGGGAEAELYDGILGALDDGTTVDRAGGAQVDGDAGQPNPDKGFQTFVREPDQVLAPFANEPLPAAGPRRARALRTRTSGNRLAKAGTAGLRATCPARETEPCRGVARLTGGTIGAPRPIRYALAPGATRVLRFRLSRAVQRRSRRLGALTATATAVNADATPGGTPAAIGVRWARARR